MSKLKKAVTAREPQVYISVDTATPTVGDTVAEPESLPIANEKEDSKDANLICEALATGERISLAEVKKRLGFFVVPGNAGLPEDAGAA